MYFEIRLLIRYSVQFQFFFYSRNIESVRLFMKFSLISVPSLYVTVKIKFGIIDFCLTKFDCTEKLIVTNLFRKLFHKIMKINN